MAIKIRLDFCYDSSNYKSVHVDLSTTKAEYTVGTISPNLGLNQNEYVVHCDNKSTLDLRKSYTYNSFMRNIDVRYNYFN
jgi:hypothetical protein